MAQQQAINTGSSAGVNPPRSYASSAPEFVGGQTDPTTGYTTPASQSLADVSPAPLPPAAPTTQLGKVSAPNIAGVGGGYIGGAIGGSIGNQVGDGVAFGAAAKSTLSNLTNTLEAPIGLGTSAPTATSGLPVGTPIDAFGETTPNDVVASQSFGTAANTTANTVANAAAPAAYNVAGSALGSAAGAGIVTAGLGALEGEKSSTYVPQAAASATGAGVGSIIGGFLGELIDPLGGGAIGAPIGAAIGSTAASVLKPVQTFFHALFTF